MDETTRNAMFASLAGQAVTVRERRRDDENHLVEQAARFCRAGLPVEVAAAALGMHRATLYRRWAELGELIERHSPTDGRSDTAAVTDQLHATLRDAAGQVSA